MAGVELAAGVARVVVGHREDGRFRVSGIGRAALAGGAVAGGYVADRRAVAAALTGAFVAAERGARAERVVVAIDGDDIRTFHGLTTFEREDSDDPVSSGEAVRASRLAREEAAHAARDAAADDPALRGVATAELRDDVGGWVLDGRALGSPVGQRGRHLDVRTDIAIAPLVHAGAATGALDAAKHRATATSGAYALARLVAESGVTEGGLARLGADLTAVAVVRDGRVAATRAFALGRDALLDRAGDRREPDVWARCVVAAMAALWVEIPGRWYASGIPDELAPLAGALADAVRAERGGAAEVLPLRPALVPRVVGTGLQTDDLVAAAAAALGAEVFG